MRYLTIICVCLLSLHSCFEEEQMVAPHEQGDMENGQAAMGVDYRYQVYYDLHDNIEASSNLVSEFDLSFESSGGGWLIRLNTSMFMLAGNSGDTTFSAALKAADLEMKFDKSDGNPDSTAIGEWYVATNDSPWSHREVYLIDRGIDEKDKPQGFKKVQFDMTGENFLMRYANNDNSGDTTVLISRDPAMDRVFYSFDNGMVDIAPFPDQWSLLFTKYTTMLVTDEGENYPYIVNGVLLNPNVVSVVMDTIHSFENITRDNIVGLGLTNQSDVIGYDWKYYNFDDGVYTIEPDHNYVIRDRDGFFYKLRFIDFYSDLGEKGYPTFEFVRL